MKQFLTFTESEGVPVTLDICANYLAIGSSLGVIKVFDLSRRYTLTGSLYLPKIWCRKLLQSDAGL